MADVSYQPTFHHDPWFNNVDRITAGGPRGFNVRFDAIETDLEALSTVVGQIDSALDQVGSGGPGSTAQRRLRVPIQVFGTSTGSFGWITDANGAHPNGGSGGAFGIVPLSVPENVRLDSFRALGLYPGGPVGLTIQFLRAPTTNAAAAPEELAKITGATPGITNPFDLTIDVATGLRPADPAGFRYFVGLTATGITASNFFQVVVAAVEVLYTPT